MTLHFLLAQYLVEEKNEAMLSKYEVKYLELSILLDCFMNLVKPFRSEAPVDAT